MSKSRFEYRDVSRFLQMARDFLLGREHTLHNRFPPAVAPRTIPTPDIPRGPDDGYSNKYYYSRSAVGSVRPPVVAPVAEGPPINRDPTMKYDGGGMRPDAVCFSCAPTPGPTWWWDGHVYYEACPPAYIACDDPRVKEQPNCEPQGPSKCSSPPPPCA